jgi:hypothetical protein
MSPQSEFSPPARPIRYCPAGCHAVRAHDAVVSCRSGCAVYLLSWARWAQRRPITGLNPRRCKSRYPIRSLSGGNPRRTAGTVSRWTGLGGGQILRLAPRADLDLNCIKLTPQMLTVSPNVVGLPRTHEG